MIVFKCRNCGKEVYHFVLLVFHSKDIEMVNTVCTECDNSETFFVPPGTWYTLVTTGGSDGQD